MARPLSPPGERAPLPAGHAWRPAPLSTGVRDARARADDGPAAPAPVLRVAAVMSLIALAGYAVVVVVMLAAMGAL
jgi:hypothetical protein